METTPHDNPITLALDIGTTKVVALVGRRDEFGKIEVLGTGIAASEGVLRGEVSNIEKTVRAIGEAAGTAMRHADVELHGVHVGIAGRHIKSFEKKGILTREDPHVEISMQDVERLVRDMYMLPLEAGDRILHVIPQQYIVDHQQGIKDPIGMSGVRLEGNFHIITCQVEPANNVRRAVEKAGLQLRSLSLESLASAEAVLTEEEKEGGVAMVDIGGGTTDIAVFHDGILRHTAVIPFGGHAVTHDIKEGCFIMSQYAEKAKVKYGSALADEVFVDRIIAIPSLKGRPPKEISERNLALIIQARMEEILDYVMWEISRSGYEKKLIGGIVLTGGGALLNHLDKLVEYHTGLSCRIGKPVELLGQGYSEKLANPVYSTAIGLLERGLREEEHLQKRQAVQPHHEQEADKAAAQHAGQGVRALFETMLRRTKEWFESEPDVDL